MWGGVCDPVDCSLPGSSLHGKNTGVDCHFLLQGIFPTQGSNPGSLALQADALSSEPPGKPPGEKEEKKMSAVLGWGERLLRGDSRQENCEFKGPERLREKQGV